MKSDIDIQDDVFQYLRDNEDFWSDMSEFGLTASSLICDGRKEDAEQIVVTVLANAWTELQEAFVNVNVFIKDIRKVTKTKQAGEVIEYLTDRKKLRSICQVTAKHLEVVWGDTYRFTLDAQRVLEDAGTHMHFVNNKLLYNQINL